MCDVPCDLRTIGGLCGYQFLAAVDLDPIRYPLRPPERSLTLPVDCVPDVISIRDWLSEYTSDPDGVAVYVRCAIDTGQSRKLLVGLTVEFRNPIELFRFKLEWLCRRDDHRPIFSTRIER
jgi:hypothetical protein